MYRKLAATLSCLAILAAGGSAMAKTTRRTTKPAPSKVEVPPPAVEVKSLEIPKEEKKIEAGYKKGFYIQSPDEKFKLVITGYSQVHLEYLRSKGENDFGFRVRRAVMTFTGNIASKKFTYKTEIDWAKFQNELLADLQFNYQFFDTPSLNLQVGQQKLPWIRQQIISSSSQQFNDRSIASEEFQNTQASDTNADGIADKISRNPRDIGLKIHGKVADGKLEYEVGAYNGSGTNSFNFNNHLFYATRVVYNIMGNYGYSEGDFENSEEAALFLGASANYNVQDFTDNDIIQVGGESGFKYKGFSAQGEFFLRHTSPEDPKIDNINDLGYYLQAGYFLVPKRFEIAARASQIFFDGPSNNQSEFTLGMNGFLLGNNVKLQSTYSYLPKDSANGTQNSHAFKLRLQTKF